MVTAATMRSAGRLRAMGCQRDGQSGGRIILRRFAAFRDEVAAVVGSVTNQSGNFSRTVTQTAEQLDKIVGPTLGHRHVADRVFQDQIPADDPGDDFAERRVGIGVGRARNGIIERARCNRAPRNRRRSPRRRTKSRPPVPPPAVRKPDRYG